MNDAEFKDRFEIQALWGEFTDAVMMLDFDRFAALFIPDGAWRMPFHDVAFVGREQIRSGIEYAQGLWDYFVQTTHAGSIKVEGDQAWGRAYLCEFGRFHDGRCELNYSLFHDVFRRTPDGWKFVERLHEIRYLDSSPLTGSRPQAPASRSDGADG